MNAIAWRFVISCLGSTSMGELIGFPTQKVIEEFNQKQESRGYKSDDKKYGVLINTIPLIVKIEDNEPVGEYMEIFDSYEEATQYSERILELLITFVKISVKKPFAIYESKRFDGGKNQAAQIKDLLEQTWGKGD